MANETDKDGQLLAGGAAKALDLPLADTVPDTGHLAAALDGAGLEQVADPGARLVLPMDALLPDADGAVVLEDFGAARIALSGDVGVSGRGIVEASIEAAGQDVAGLAYVALENGVTLYFPPEADIKVG